MYIKLKSLNKQNLLIKQRHNLEQYFMSFSFIYLPGKT